MNRDDIFNSTAARGSDFQFTEEVANVFDDMLARSVPFYLEQQSLIEEVARKFWIPGTAVVDLGSSTGTTLIRLADQLGPEASLIGYDNSEPMLERARGNADKAGMGDRIEFKFADLNGSLGDVSIEGASVVIICWTLQFIRPLRRDILIKKIYDGLEDGGALIVTEKVLTNDSNMNRFFIEFYYDFKRRNGYSEEEIMKKREALENVLIPYRFDENFELFRSNGFQTVETFFQWYNFAGFLCVKNPA
ncbi:MAG TPA: carboxy-S-adenosyl-L-methionine synthase CmoA [Gammaproteobacteria bacterium]|nr:carboxy-S-adenosyl-L-methionine synthase CmoA [Gammaproteobacteria bacterium]